MPLALTVAPDTAVLVVAQRGSVWQRLQRLARRAIEPLRTFWWTLFTDMRRRLDVSTLTEALWAAHLLNAEQEAMRVWRDAVEDEARAFLPVVLRQIATRTGTVVIRAFTEETGQAVRLPPDSGETQREMDQYAQQQVTFITGTTLLGLRQLLRAGWLADMSAASHAQIVHDGFGLTPQQIQSLTLARKRWQQEGRSVTVIRDAIQQAVALGVSRRVRAIAETQAFGAVNLGHRLAMTQVAQTSLGQGVQMRRYWHIQPGACPVCRAVPGMNPQGVGLTDPFATPQGPVMDAPLHVMCRCAADYRLPGVP